MQSLEFRWGNLIELKNHTLEREQRGFRLFARLLVGTVNAAVGSKCCHFEDCRKCWGRETSFKVIRDQL